MPGLLNGFRIAVLLLLAVSASQCTVIRIQKEIPSDTLYAEYRGLKASGFQKEIEWLLEAAKKPTDGNFAVNTHLKLAFLFSHYKNPAPDYPRALKELRTFESQDPKYARNDFVRNWRRMLEEIVSLSGRNEELRDRAERLSKEISDIESANNDLHSANKSLERELRKLESANKELESEKEMISEKLKQLKTIDVELEEKRKQIKQ